jgi:hypothetical protein
MRFYTNKDEGHNFAIYNIWGKQFGDQMRFCTALLTPLTQFVSGHARRLS